MDLSQTTLGINGDDNEFKGSVLKIGDGIWNIIFNDEYFKNMVKYKLLEENTFSLESR